MRSKQVRHFKTAEKWNLPLNLAKYICVQLLIFFFLLPNLALAEKSIEVIIQGIEGRLYDNIISRLSIYKNRDEKELTRRKVNTLHNGAEEEIKKALQPFGYYSPNILSKLEGEENGWRAHYSIEKGLPVKIKNIQISIEATTPPLPEFDTILQSFPLKEEDVLDHYLYSKGKKLLLRQLYALGFLKAEYVRNEILVDRNTKSGDIILLLRSGPLFLFGKTTFHQDLMDPELLHRYVHYREGDPYSPRKLTELQQILYKTNYFGQVIIKGETEKADDLHVPVNITLSEPAFFNRYTVGLGYATDNGLRGKIGWDNRLLNSHGHTVTSEINIAEREDSLEIIYGVPVNDTRFDKVLLGGIYNDETWEKTITRLFKGGLRYEHSAKKFKYGGGLELRDERYNVGSTSGHSFLPVPQLSWSMAISDDLVHTRNGLLVSANVSGASEDFFGDTTFLQGQISGKLITTPLEGFRLIGRLSFGATSVDSIDDLPPSLRFYAGGDQSVRGYGYNELGPQDSSGTVIGGKYMILSSIEAEKIVSGNWSFAAFFDNGNAINDLSTDLKEGVGVGVRYRLPFGQVRIDVASAISEEDNPLRLHLTVGGDL